MAMESRLVSQKSKVQGNNRNNDERSRNRLRRGMYECALEGNKQAQKLFEDPAPPKENKKPRKAYLSSLFS